MIATYDFNDAIGAPTITQPTIESYQTSDVNFLPLRIDVDEKQVYVIVKSQNSKIALPDSMSDLNVPSCVSVEDCVTQSQLILGLKINEIAKILGLSRATLDLHRKGKVKNIQPYYSLYDFAKQIEAKFGSSVAPLIRSVLVERKTLLQHMMVNKKNLNNSLYYFDLVAKLSPNVSIFKEPLDKDKTANRLANIGRRG